MALGALLTCAIAKASQLVEVLPLNDQIVMLHWDDGYVVHHGIGQRRGDEEVIVRPLNVSRAMKPSSYSIRIGSETVQPTRVSRKSKGTDFAWFVDYWFENKAVNEKPDHAREHWIYLALPKPIPAGATVEVSMPDLEDEPVRAEFVFDVAKVRSEAVHTNVIGYLPWAPDKFAYLFHWAGDGGSVDFSRWNDAPFHLRDRDTGKVVFEGKLAFRKDAANQETFHVTDSPPNGNFLKADVWQADFSKFETPGEYIVSIPGVGCSFPFRIAPDSYREPFVTTIRGLYHNRSGIALVEPYTQFTRPAPHNPKLTPGFAGKLMYTKVPYSEWGSEGGDEAKLRAGFVGPLESAGWYQDAGDWDSYPTHLRVPIELLIGFQLTPKGFADGELNIPESGNGIPDQLDEAAWLPRFCYRLRHELLDKKYATGGIGLRIAGDAFGSDGEGIPSYKDVHRIWAASGEDPISTFGYAGVAAHLAYLLADLGKKDPEGIDWAKESREAFDWAMAHDASGTQAYRTYAAACLFRLTGDARYERQLAKDLADIPEGPVFEERMYGIMVRALGAQPGDLLTKTRAWVLATADETLLGTSAKRALRWGGNFSMPMLIGQQTTPMILEGPVARELTRVSDPEKSLSYLAAICTTCDFFLGGNALNATWVTGLGPRHPNQVFHMDAWYNGKPTPHPGVIPYGPWLKQSEFGQGPWDAAWPNKTLYPMGVDAWPGGERWYDNRCSPMNSEFTIHQNTAPAAVIFGYLFAQK